MTQVHTESQKDKSPGSGRNLSLPAEQLIQVYRTMLRIRRFEERATSLFAEGFIKGTAHSSIGQEAIAAAVCAQLNPDDFIATYHRGHGHCIAKGASTSRMMAELLGKSTGYCGGLGGSMHVADMDLNIIGANGVVAAGLPLATGAALAIKIKGLSQVSVAFFGDGGANEGVFHESLNLAAIWKLPVLFICENNRYAYSTLFSSTTSIDMISDRSISYGIPGITVDGNDAVDVYAAVSDAVERARGGQGPTLIEALTYRWGNHSMRGGVADLRPQEEVKQWIALDPIVRIESKLTSEGVATAVELERISSEINREIEDATTFAKDSPNPNENFMMSSVYAPHIHIDEPDVPDGERSLTFTQAIAEAMTQEMERDPSVFVMGEDIGRLGGSFKATEGMLERFGGERVRETPISEAAFVGCGIGAAIAGLRPIVEIQIFDFVTLTMDMLVNQAAKLRFMLGGRLNVPLVVRGPQGGGIRLAAQHSQSLEAWFTHVPGLMVVAPSSPRDAKGLLVSAIRENNPVIFLESKLLMVSPASPVPSELYAIPLGKGAICQKGTDVTVVATMAMVPRAISAAQLLEREGISVEVIDPRTLSPLDEELVLESVRKTNRLVIAHEAWTQGGFGSEVSAIVTEKAFDWLDAPILRVGALPVPMPYNDELERMVIPSQQRIADAIRECVS
jgi:2-oxoisovalerate dehydrogenase E1 component